MKYIIDERKLKFHYFYWATSFIRFGGFLNEYIKEKVQYATLSPNSLYGGVPIRTLFFIDCVFFILGLIFTLGEMFGLFNRHAYGWICVMAESILFIPFFVYIIAFYYPDMEIGEIGGCVGAIIVSVFIMVYYYLRKPLFSIGVNTTTYSQQKESIRKINGSDVSSDNEATTKCIHCGNYIPKDSLFCDCCGKSIENKPVLSKQQIEALADKLVQIRDGIDLQEDNQNEVESDSKDKEFEEIRNRLEQYKSMFEDGLITQEEYSQLKSKLLNL